MRLSSKAQTSNCTMLGVVQHRLYDDGCAQGSVKGDLTLPRIRGCMCGRKFGR